MGRAVLKSELNMPEEQDTPATFLTLRSLSKFICCACQGELSMKAARFHRLHCKSDRVTGYVVNGVRRSENEKHVTADT